jgi:hypothetical protein
MFKKLLMIGLALSCYLGIAQANEPATACSKDAGALCDVSFTSAPAFGPMCIGATQTRVFTIQNNTPVTQTFDYIKVVNADGSNNLDATIDPSPTLTTCGATLAAGTKCNIAVDVTPSVAETFNLLLEVKMVGTGKPISEPITLSALDACNVAFVLPPPVFTDVCTGGTVEKQTFTISNASNSPATISSIGIQNNDSLPNAVVTIDTGPGTTCSVGTNTLPANSTCNIVIDVTPGATPGAIHRILQVSIDSGFIHLAQPIDLNVTNSTNFCSTDLVFVTPLPVPTSMVCNVPQTVTYIVKNNNSSSETIASITPSNNGGVGTATVNNTSSTCVTTPTVAPHGTCTIVVDLNSATAGTINQILTVVGSANTITTNIVAPVTCSSSPPEAIDYLNNVAGNAGACAVLAGSTVTNTGNTVVTNGDVCVYPGTAITGFPAESGPGIIIGGIEQPGTPVAFNAQAGLTNALTTLQALPCPNVLTGQDLGTLTLTAGVYCFSSSAQLTGTLTLQGDANSVFVFQIGTTLTTATASQVVLLGVNPANVYWVEQASATLGTGTIFQGNILARASITLNTGASLIYGRALASTAAVTMADNAVTVPPVAP